MERNIRLKIAYDGAEFHGWQSQPGLRTVQGEIENAARRVCNHPLTVHGAGRTDAGVHARGQVANFVTTGQIPAKNLFQAIGHRLPEDIALVHLDEVPLDFHASRSAVAKLYRYRIYNSQARPVEELSQRYSWHVWYPLDTGRMQSAARLLLGEHDFAGFATAGSQRATTVRTIHRFEVRRDYHDVFLDVEGNGFLYNQVRNMVGTLVEIGRGHWPVERIAEILSACDRRLAGRTAPAGGLCMQWVRY